MAVNYMDRLAALRGDHSHAAGASAPVLHADEKKKSRKKKRKLSKKQKAALAKGWRLMKAKRRAEKKMAKKKRKSSKRSAPKRKSKRGYKSAAGRRTARIGAFHRRAHKAGKRVRKRKSKGVTTYTFAPKRKRSKSRKAPKRSKSRKHKKRKSVMGHRKSSKRVAAGKKAARTRKRHKAERAAARRRGGRSHKRHGHRKHKRHAHKRAAPRRRKRGGRARRRSGGNIRRNNRSGKFVGRGGRSRRSHVVHYGASRKRGGYHRAGRIVKENYSMENPLDMSELATGLGAGLLGYIAADVADRMIAGRGVLGGTLYAEAAPIYSDYMRLGAGLLMAAAPLVGAHFVNGAKHRHLRAGLQFFGFGAGVRTLGHLFTDLVSSQLKGNATVGPTIQALYPHEIASAGQIAGAKVAGAGALPEQIGEAARGLGMIPEGLAACCNASSRMLNPALSVLQPIGRSAEMGGAAAGFAPPPVALPPPIERIVQQPFSPPSVTRQATPIPMTPAVPPPPGFQQQPQLPSARQVVAATNPMTAAYVPQPALPAPVGAPSFVGPAGLPASPFAWGNNDSPE